MYQGITEHKETQAGQRREGQALRGSGRRCYHRWHGKRAAANLEYCRQLLVGVCRDNGGMRGQVGEGRELEASVAEKVDSTGEELRQRGSEGPDVGSSSKRATM